MIGFSSIFAPSINAMFDYREALGYSRNTHEANLLAFDRYCAERGTQDILLTESLVWGWLNDLSAKKRSGMREKAASIRTFGKYLSATGQNAYVLPDGIFAAKKTLPPYIFTDKELAALFWSADNLPSSKNDSVVIIAPVLFRLIYTCGLRPNEGRELKRENINFATGEILITKTKLRKERVVVMSDDMREFCGDYDTRSKNLRSHGEFFFPFNNGNPFTSRQMNELFNRCWQWANPTVKTLPNVRVYDLRHRFASAVLNRWLDEGKDLYAMLPYLSAYMGHDKLSETAYYIHILPENLVKSAGIDWASFAELMPEVNS